MQQLPLDLRPEALPRFDTYLPGANTAAVAELQALLSPRAGAAPPVFLWGPTGCGKTHLLRALAEAAGRCGVPVGWWQKAEAVAIDHAAVLLLDDVEQLDAPAQHRAFGALVAATERGATWVAAARMPPVDLPLRDDLRTRLGWGPVYALQPLADSEARATLLREADRRDLRLGEDVLHYLLTRLPRSLGTLMPLLDRLDTYSLAQHRQVSLPLLKQMLAEEPPPP